ncbi:MAG: type I glyceraldehyde-3-phosphate dehydrogenase [Patescibacteria group bacterium]|nr:type I glyceraldehyde-3-phosphate dehydrogenase [Patescibacteria group bacterium]
MNIAINGFGRIGRTTFKALLERKSGNKIVAINDLTDVRTLAHLLKHDTCYGEYKDDVSYKDDNLIVAGKKYKVLAEKEPAKLPWQELGVDIVLECTGRFTKKEEATAHLEAGAKKVIISAPAKSDDVKTIALSVNENDLKKEDAIISMASCTTNCLAPVMNIIKDNFGVKKAVMTTTHAYTADQNLVDGPHKDLRRARAAAANIIPTTTGAAIATAKTIPELDGLFDGLALRVPVAVSSICDITVLLKNPVDEEKMNEAFRKAIKETRYKNIVDVTEEPLVSSDFIGNSHSAIIDLSLTKVIDGDLVKVVAWYDNEWGYSCRLAELVEYIGKKRLI